jgi:hypothetical protein
MTSYWDFPYFFQVTAGNTEYEEAGFSIGPVHVITNELNSLT